MPTTRIEPKTAAALLTLEGFMRWTQGQKIQAQDFKKLGR